MTGLQAGVQGVAIVRAANAMLSSLGGEEITLLFPSMGMASDTASQLGLVDPGVDEVPLGPVIARSLATDNIGPRRRIEFLLPASAVSDVLAERGFPSGGDLIDAALGIVYQNEIFHIEGFLCEEFASTPYLYRVTAVD